MITILLKALGAIVVRLFAAAASEEMLEWLIIKVGETIVESTKTKHDDEWFHRFVAEYKKIKKTK